MVGSSSKEGRWKIDDVSLVRTKKNEDPTCPTQSHTPFSIVHLLHPCDPHRTSLPDFLPFARS